MCICSEDWPVMPVEHCGFKLKPAGFFTSSPIMDIPQSSVCHLLDGGNTENKAKCHAV